MVNKKYQAGRRFEYAVKKYLEGKGYIVLRTAGSHGFADLVALGNSEILFIQCKYGTKPTKKDREKLHDIFYTRLEYSTYSIFVLFVQQEPYKKFKFYEVTFADKELREVII